MKLDRTGFILYTVNYKECVHFYESILELPKLFESENLTCFEFGTAYLMVELDDEFNEEKKESTRTKTCLRMNVSNIQYVKNKLIQKEVNVDYQEHTWGSVVKFFDPDGNLCAFKDSSTFEQQILKFKN